MKKHLQFLALWDFHKQSFGIPFNSTLNSHSQPLTLMCLARHNKKAQLLSTPFISSLVLGNHKLRTHKLMVFSQDEWASHSHGLSCFKYIPSASSMYVSRDRLRENRLGIRISPADGIAQGLFELPEVDDSIFILQYTEISHLEEKNFILLP